MHANITTIMHDGSFLPASVHLWKKVHLLSRASVFVDFVRKKEFEAENDNCSLTLRYHTLPYITVIYLTLLYLGLPSLTLPYLDLLFPNLHLP